jgi:hypothetical protein
VWYFKRYNLEEIFRNNPHRGICRMYVKPQSDYVQARISYNPETTQFAMPTGSRTHSKNRCAYRSLSRHSPYACKKLLALV